MQMTDRNDRDESQMHFTDVLFRNAHIHINAAAEVKGSLTSRSGIQEYTHIRGYEGQMIPHFPFRNAGIHTYIYGAAELK